jgi:AhpD family alkylhydroperoxidase
MLRRTVRKTNRTDRILGAPRVFLSLRFGFSKAADPVAGFVALDRGANKTPHLDAKTRELIAVAIAVTMRCDGCIGVHTDRAINAGATREEVAEALGVAVTLNAGAALAYSARVLDAYATISAAKAAPE